MEVFVRTIEVWELDLLAFFLIRPLICRRSRGLSYSTYGILVKMSLVCLPYLHLAVFPEVLAQRLYIH